MVSRRGNNCIYFKFSCRYLYIRNYRCQWLHKNKLGYFDTTHSNHIDKYEDQCFLFWRIKWFN